jgi:hypothetical protein
MTTTTAITRSEEANHGVVVPNKWYEDWVKENMKDMTGQVAIVTGANSGTGFWAAMAVRKFKKYVKSPLLYLCIELVLWSLTHENRFFASYKNPRS